MDIINKFSSEARKVSEDELSIIIVDDMHFSRAVIRQTLSEFGYSDIRVASSGAEVLRMLDMRAADVLLADWVMPEMNGLELTEKVRALGDEFNWYTSIILFTTKDGATAIGEAFSHGVDDYINKPVNSFELLARVYSAGRIAKIQNKLLLQSQALENLQVHQETLITLDLLTGLPNRHEFRRRLDNSIKQAASRGGSFCVAVLQVSNLEEINDQYGHEVGDQVLMSVSRKLKRQLRPLDFVGRYKGDRFVIILHNDMVVLHGAKILRRIVNTITAKPIASSSGLLDVAIGVGALTGSDKKSPGTPKKVERHLKSALEKANSKGPNSITLLQTSPQE